MIGSAALAIGLDWNSAGVMSPRKSCKNGMKAVEVWLTRHGFAVELRLVAARKFITPNTSGEEINPLEI